MQSAILPANILCESLRASGTDGLKLTRRILGNAADYLADDGVLICEVGNSMVHLMEQYPDVPFTWLEFDNGGDGVFMLTKEQLLAAIPGEYVWHWKMKRATDRTLVWWKSPFSRTVK